MATVIISTRDRFSALKVKLQGHGASSSSSSSSSAAAVVVVVVV